MVLHYCWWACRCVISFLLYLVLCASQQRHENWRGRSLSSASESTKCWRKIKINARSSYAEIKTTKSFVLFLCSFFFFWLPSQQSFISLLLQATKIWLYRGCQLDPPQSSSFFTWFKEISVFKLRNIICGFDVDHNLLFLLFFFFFLKKSFIINTWCYKGEGWYKVLMHENALVGVRSDSNWVLPSYVKDSRWCTSVCHSSFMKKRRNYRRIMVKS